MQLLSFLFPVQHMKRPPLQNKPFQVLRMAFRAQKFFRTFEKRAPGLTRGYPVGRYPFMYLGGERHRGNKVPKNTTQYLRPGPESEPRERTGHKATAPPT